MFCTNFEQGFALGVGFVLTLRRFYNMFCTNFEQGFALGVGFCTYFEVFTLCFVLTLSEVLPNGFVLTYFE